MKFNRKISVRKILQVFVTVVATACCVVAMVSAAKIEDSKTVKSVGVHIKNDKKYHFIEQQEILDLAITSRQIDMAHTPISKLDLHAMEQTIKSDPWVAGAQVYIDNDQVLQLYVTQRIPVVRIFGQDSKSYYLDTTLSIMPLSDNYIYYTTVVTNVPELKNDSAGWATRKSIVSLVRTIQADSFWSAQVAEVILDSVGVFELLPVLGEQKILFGTATNMKEKFDDLFSFYKNVLNRIGWDKYETLDVRFGGQVVASPSLPYTGPVDKAVTNMNWINSIVETEAKNDTKDSIKHEEVKVIKAMAAKQAAAKKLPAKKQLAKKQKVTGGKTKQVTKKDKQKQKSPKYVYPKKDN